jgi:hypothetical protein
MYADVLFVPQPLLKSDFGKFNYIHKIKDGRHIYFFTNSSNETIRTDVLLRGKLKPEAWDPHTGRIYKELEYTIQKIKNVTYTKVELKLDPVSSVFYLSAK